MRWVSSHVQRTLEVGALELGPQWLASVALGNKSAKSLMDLMRHRDALEHVQDLS